MPANTLHYQSVLFYAQKQRTNPQAPPKTGVEILGTFESLHQAKELSAQAYSRNQHAYTGFGVMVELGQADGKEPQI